MKKTPGPGFFHEKNFRAGFFHEKKERTQTATGSPGTDRYWPAGFDPD
jgi:hypothetical protein